MSVCSVPDCERMATFIEAFMDGKAYCMTHEWYSTRSEDLLKEKQWDRLVTLSQSKEFMNPSQNIVTSWPARAMEIVAIAVANGGKPSPLHVPEFLQMLDGQ